MTDICVLPDFSTEQATIIVERLYGLSGTLKILNGERDLNYLLETDNRRYVFKIANQDEPYGMLECQHQVLQRLMSDNVLQQQASSLRSIDGRVIEIITSESGINHYCRVLNYVEGELLSSIDPQSPGLLYDLGKTLAQIDLSLQGYSHQALDRPLLWNMRDGLTILERFKPLLASDDRRNLIRYFESHFRNSIMPLIDSLRVGVIHNDANDNNVLVTLNQASQQAIAGIIDFGDMVDSWLAAEPAIAAAYAMLGKDEPLEAAVAIIKGYHAQLPFNEAEVSALFGFICMRLCMSVCICAHQRSIEPENEYLSISEQPAWTLLKKLKAINPDVALDLFRETCKVNNRA